MVTKVGMQSDFVNALKDLLELDYDAIEAYEEAIKRVKNEGYKSQLIEFKNDHISHTDEISAILKQHNIEAPKGPSGKQWLTKGKVVLADLIGDKTILLAMISNEIDTNIAYERLNYHSNKWQEASSFLKRGLDDERRHKAWLESIVNNQDNISS